MVGGFTVAGFGSKIHMRNESGGEGIGCEGAMFFCQTSLSQPMTSERRCEINYQKLTYFHTGINFPNFKKRMFLWKSN